MAAGDLHRGFVGLHSGQALLCLDGVAHLDHHFNDDHIFEVADVGNKHLHRPSRHGRRRYRSHRSCY